MACRPAERLGHLRIVLGLSTSELAVKLNVSERRIHRLLKCRDKPSISLIARVRRCFPHVNPDWLILGEGNVFLDCTTGLSSVNIINSNHGTTNQTTYNFLKTAPSDLNTCIHHVALLEQQLADTRRIIELLEKASLSPL